MDFKAELVYDNTHKLFATPFTQARIIEIIGKPKQKSGLECRRVIISTENFVRLMGTSTSWPDIKEKSIRESTTRLWVPESLLDNGRHRSASSVLETPATMHPILPVASTSQLPEPRHLGFIEIDSDSKDSEVSNNLSQLPGPRHLGFIEINSDSENSETSAADDDQSIISITDSSDENAVPWPYTKDLSNDSSVIYISD